ncbi:phosphate ABC transporter substrate-binding/OmpA family protein [Pacificibacter marinus]|uniref:Outer membrane porin F n=1 Tax=Pacificibacter marinus TaxID=658057 RepID=A0A1Y5T2E7_9RHOB|nr:phosphate ABC transporter substrate-binding/OmpA family protein [Pacificibacter marinus]SEL02232.1 phosphate ABC transporter substrate-binding protein, PhoT family [Pacificibacter marinus]SLN52475.1 Outer membrane porin F precursor [Pacificibacter marinus]
MGALRAGITAAFTLAAGLSCMAAYAQDVSLTSRDGSVSVSGDFLGFDGEFYRVDTEYGTLTIDGTGVRCDGPGCPDLNSFYPIVRFSGDRAVSVSLLPALTSAFAARYGYNTEITVSDDVYSVVLMDTVTGAPAALMEFSQTSSAEGFADLLTENTDIAVSLREVNTQERKMAKDAGMGDLSDPIRARVLGLDAIVPIVSPSNPLTTISITDLENILSGDVKNWKDIGGQDAPIVLFLDENTTSDSASLLKMLVNSNADALNSGLSILASVQTSVEAIENDPYGLTFARLSTVGKVKVLGLTGACGFRTNVVSSDVKTEDYPLTQPMFLYTPARRLPKIARDFLDYVLSPAAQIVIARSPFVDQGIEELGFRDHGRRFANAIQHAGDEIGLEDLQAIVNDLYGARRLSLGFRFEDGTARLDAQSLSNIQLLAQLIEAGVYDNKKLVFAGFSDGQGAASVNKRLSSKRATAVRNAVIAALGEAAQTDLLTTEIRGFGEAMPLACDDVAWGRGLNRRVEIWVRDDVYK